MCKFELLFGGLFVTKSTTTIFMYRSTCAAFFSSTQSHRCTSGTCMLTQNVPASMSSFYARRSITVIFLPVLNKEQ